MADRLDALLEEARPPEPQDDGFTQLVMEHVRADAQKRSSKYRRFFTRPMALAAAAVIVTGGALAAVRSVTQPDEDAPPPPPPAASIDVALPPTVPEVTASVADTAEVLAPVSGGEVEAPQQTTWRQGDFEWGYTSDHTSYVLDHGTGLRLETETYTNAFEVGKPQKVTLTITNTTSRTIGVYSPDSCALSVLAARAESGEKDGAAFDPVTAKDGSEGWRCAGTDTRTGGRAQKWILPPGASRTRDADVVAERPGTWSIFGMCRCQVVGAQSDEQDDPDAGLLEPLTRFVLPAPGGQEASDESSSEPRRGPTRLVTPPIRVVGA